MSAYINQLRRECFEAAAAPPQLTLSQRLTDWHASLPAVSRDRPFSMSELESAMATQGRYIGVELLRLGWSRKRIWLRSGSYSRYWVPPRYSN